MKRDCAFAAIATDLGLLFLNRISSPCNLWSCLESFYTEWSQTSPRPLVSPLSDRLSNRLTIKIICIYSTQYYSGEFTFSANDYKLWSDNETWLGIIALTLILKQIRWNNDSCHFISIVLFGKRKIFVITFWHQRYLYNCKAGHK